MECSNVWWPMECSKLLGPWKKKENVLLLGGQWKEKEKVPMFGGQWKEKEKVPMLGGQWKEKGSHAWWPMERQG